MAACLFRLSPSLRFRNWLQRTVPFIELVRNARLVGDIRGGDSFSDIYGLTRYAFGSMLPLAALLSGARLIQFPQTYGPYHSTISALTARWILRKSHWIMARDRDSLAVARALAPHHKFTILSPDVAFSLQPHEPNRLVTHPQLSAPLLQPIVGLNVNALMYHGGYTKKNMFSLRLDYAAFLPRLVTRLLEISNGEVWLVPHTFAPAGNIQSDPEVSLQLYERLPADQKSRVRVVTYPYDEYEIKSLIGQCDFFIGSRMHSCIAALSQAIPCVGIAYSMKFRGVFETVGQHRAIIDGRTDDAETAMSRIEELYKSRQQIRSELSAAAPAARQRLFSVFSNLYSDATSNSEPAPITEKLTSKAQ